ncbi:MAG TPA: hypothetical protein VFL27_12235 [Candidatus Dormibacteraeota bacterium]|nr:hypothetical protein [Candidatus Dormibacteraeota bacterium]
MELEAGAARYPRTGQYGGFDRVAWVEVETLQHAVDHEKTPVSGSRWRAPLMRISG